MKWEPVPSGSRNGLLIGYRVRYQQTFNNGIDGEIKTLFRSFFFTEATLTGLEKASVYVIAVAGVTLSGTGLYSEPLTALTCKFKTVPFYNLMEVFEILETFMSTISATFQINVLV